MSFFFFNDTATPEIYTLSLHDALPISGVGAAIGRFAANGVRMSSQDFDSLGLPAPLVSALRRRSEEHTSELQSRQYLVCRLLLEKKHYKEREVSRNYTLTGNSTQRVSQ